MTNKSMLFIILGPPQPSGRGPRIIMCAVGDESGFVPGSEKMFIGMKAKNATQDYHSEINAQTFEAWIRHVIPLILRIF